MGEGMGKRKDAWNSIWNLDAKSENRFDTFKPQFGVDAMRGVMDKLYGQQRENVESTFNRDTNKRMSQARKGMGSRMLSQGITGGSMMNDSIAGAEEDVLESGYGGLSNALASLGIGRMQSEVPLMQYGNEMDFRTTSAGQNVDMQNIINQMRKSGMLQGAAEDWDRMDFERENAPGLLDDIFAGLGVGAQAMTGLGGLGLKLFGK